MTIEQTVCLDGIKFTTISLGRMCKERGDKLAAKLNGKTFMNFEIIVAPAGGECAISAETTYDGTTDKILGMFLYLMATELARA